MKKTDLERLKESKISSAMAQAVTPGRFGREAAQQLSRREQRKIDQAKGLIPFAVKLHSELIKRLHDRAQQRGISLNELSEELLEKGLGTAQSATPQNPVPAAPPAAQPAPLEVPASAAKPKPVTAAKKAPEVKKAPAAKKAPVAKKPATKAKTPAAATKKPVAAKPKKK